MGVLKFLFGAAILLLAALPLGLKFQCRRFPLLLAHPKSRWKTWSERTLLAITIVFACGSVLLVSQMFLMMENVRILVEAYANDFSSMWWGDYAFAHDRFMFSDLLSKDSLMVLGFMVVTACSAGFWTLSAGSVIAGIVFTFAGEVAGTTVVYFAVSK